MAAYATKYSVYFPKLYSWLAESPERIEVTRDINRALMFDEVSQVEGMLTSLKITEAVIQKYKATLVITDNFYWTAPKA